MLKSQRRKVLHIYQAEKERQKPFRCIGVRENKPAASRSHPGTSDKNDLE